MNSSFVTKSVSTLTLGEKLSKFRHERRISLHEAARYTKIQAKYLEYLEAGAYEKLPAEVYVKGFLRTYAEFLNVDGNLLIRLYDKEKGIRQNLEKNKNPRDDWQKEKKKNFNPNAFVVTPKIIVSSLVALLIFGGFFYLYREVGSFAAEPRLVILSPEKNQITDSNSLTVEGVTDEDARIFINEQPILINENGEFRETLTIQSGTNVITVKAINRFDKETTETLNIQSNNQEIITEAPTDGVNQELADQKGLEMEVRVEPGPVWLSVEADGNLVFSGTMLAGAVQTFKAQEKIMINSGNASATFIKFNGQDMGSLGEKAEPVRGAVFTAETKIE